MISLRDVVTGFGVCDPLAEVWRRSLRGGGGGAAEITGVPPLRYIGDGRPLTDYLISGNTVQNSTPSPDAPVDATGCGVWDEAQQSYKLPLTVNGAEHPIYLGQVETTRRMKKLVLTGDGIILRDREREGSWRFFTDKLISAKDSTGICSHFENIGTNGVNNSDNIGFSIFNNAQFGCRCPKSIADTVTDFKAYLAAQYANGTPVTVWYVLAEPETAVVNEPLMKIGDYADTISFAQSQVAIPTVNGENVLDVPTEVPPSEVWIRGKIKEV